MTPRIAVAHYPEGAGHATRMLAVAWALEERGATVTVASGGPGTRFVRMNGYEPYVPTPVDFIDTRQFDRGGVITNSVPNAVRRVYDLAGWLRRESPVAVVTDDMFATMAATLTRTPVYYLTHNTPELYTQLLERTATTVLTRYHRLVARSFFYPAVWEPCRADPNGVTRVPPIALEGDSDTPEIDVLIVPSVYSSGVTALASQLRTRGRNVTRVGGSAWEPVASLFPYIASATTVVCSGYSTVMEAAVAGTPCVVRPFTDEQRGVTRLLKGTDGFAVAETSREVTECVVNPPPLPEFENGTEIIADRVMAEIEPEYTLESTRST
ncbi:glycosyltransferase [Halocatena salina]|uniref:UDP:flavonoid glycosyltransferase YjiC, YdhE family n=1 Tax=Halocatena salina TaxID=2934340 RepID=A0A8U0A174_9EURY|nr:hypothetical protein [Halocatena salina]UPM42616.1 hypothetical protein MW046_11710 [Halocatena salina]